MALKRLGTAAVIAALLTLTGSAVAQERVKVKVAALTLPVFNPIIVNLMKEKGIDEADGIVARTVKLPPGVFKEAIASGRRVVDVRPAWQTRERKSIWDMFERAVAAKYLEKLPDDAIIYAP